MAEPNRLSKKRKLKSPRRPPDAQGNIHAVGHHHGRIREALALYERVLLLKPDFADAHNNLGVALTQLGRIHDAREHFERAVALNPGYADAHTTWVIRSRRKARGSRRISSAPAP
jgi:tetratricopeptide (TPR) repeat protein